MERQPVTSSNIVSVGHDQNVDVLEVEFQSGAVWQYHGVTAETHANMIAAPSVGGYFAREIRGNYNEAKISG